jgi:WD40 repeat protein
VEKVKVDVMPRAIWCPTSTKTVKAFGMSKNKTMAAVGQRHGRISIVRVPSLVELWKFSTEGYVSCCTFSPDDSLVLFGELQYALSIAERKEVPFFDRHNESFKSCAFSPNGKRLTTSDGSSSIKVWDVPEQSLLSLLSADVRVNRCSFSATGMFITANWKYDADHSITTLSNNEDDDFEYYPDFDEEESDAEDSYCVWNAITWQRCDGRSLHERKLEKGEASQDKPCKRCSQPKFDKVIFDVEPFIPLESRKLPYESLSTGIYHDVECIFALGEKSLSVIENTHFTTFAVWNCFFDGIYDFIVKRHDEKKIFRE